MGCLTRVFLGPIEKGANDGQASFGTDLIKALRQGVAPKTRTTKTGKGKVKRQRVATVQAGVAATASVSAKSVRQSANWGLLEPLRRPLSPIIDTFQPFVTSNVVLGMLFVMVVMMWLRTPSQTSVSHPGIGYSGYHAPSLTERMIAYEELWRREESDLWDWLEERVGLESSAFLDSASNHEDHQTHLKVKIRRSKSERDLDSRLRDEKMTEREIEDAIRVTHERLEILQRVIERRKREQADNTV